MRLTNLPSYNLSEVYLPDPWPGVTLIWSDGGDVEIVGATAEQIQAVKRAVYLAAGVDFLAEVKAAAFDHLNTWRGARRAALGLTSAEFQELVYTGKVLECQRWLSEWRMANGESSAFGLALEAAARGLSNETMAALVLGQWAAWAAGSDAIEAGYIVARAAVEGAGDEAAVAAVLAGLGWG